MGWLCCGAQISMLRSRRRCGDGLRPQSIGGSIPLLLFEVTIADCPVSRSAERMPSTVKLVRRRLVAFERIADIWWPTDNAVSKAGCGARPAWVPEHIPACSIFLPSFPLQGYEGSTTAETPYAVRSDASEHCFCRVPWKLLIPCLVIIVMP